MALKKFTFMNFFQGILLFDPKVGATPEKITRLWIHEVYRVFYDRLVDQQDRRKFFDIVKVGFSSPFIFSSFVF